MMGTALLEEALRERWNEEAKDTESYYCTLNCSTICT